MKRRTALAALGLGVAAAQWGCSLGPRDSAEDLDTPAQKPTLRNYPVAWVLSSGGPRGFVHVGVLKALFELGLKPDLVVGSSVGALVGCLAAAGVGMARIEALALETSMASLFRLNFSGDLWLNGAGLAALVNETVADQRLQQFATPFAAVAMRQHPQELVAFNWGNAGLAVQAACAVEGRLAPVRIAQSDYLDADRLSPLPVRLARQMGATRVLAIDASAHEDKAPPTATGYGASDLRKRESTQADAVHADMVLHPEFGYYTGVSREYRERTIAAGYQQTLLQAQALRQLHAILSA
ncbi:MAG: patatin-like phospholipase family protein [Rhodoferax sp.]|uniref:patatin-like phospholipase family protein n=1 Tax=Rhodoferax sp. TaxID=50421 RepID=UPI001B418315|nr:patatin-like phospholipase family protein [Rhodoferax sp.]MBP9150087.1 patatin-like phospholipase family protein [Rhodoferax sp.]MBP9735574.1 patatin-like phospholipase family protein [Rhodoferax sp.]